MSGSAAIRRGWGTSEPGSAQDPRLAAHGLVAVSPLVPAAGVAGRRSGRRARNATRCSGFLPPGARPVRSGRRPGHGGPSIRPAGPGSTGVSLISPVRGHCPYNCIRACAVGHRPNRAGRIGCPEMVERRILSRKRDRGSSSEFVCGSPGGERNRYWRQRPIWWPATGTTLSP